MNVNPKTRIMNIVSFAGKELVYMKENCMKGITSVIKTLGFVRTVLTVSRTNANGRLYRKFRPCWIVDIHHFRTPEL